MPPKRQLITLDASIIIAHFNEADTHHPAAEAFFTEHIDAEFLMHTLTIAEVLVVPTRMRRVEQAMRWLGRLGVAEWNHSPGEARHLAELRVESGLRMPDVCVLDTALSTNAALATFDTALASAARSLGVTLLPEGP